MRASSAGPARLFAVAGTKRTGLHVGDDVRVLALALCVAGVVTAAFAAPASARNAYVINAGPDTVSVIDTATNTVVGSPIPVGLNPGAIAITPDGTRAYVANFTAGTVSVIDTATNAVVGNPITTDIFTDGGVAITPDGGRVYVAGRISGTGGAVAVIDTATNTLLPAHIGLGNPADPRGIAITPNGSRAYVTIKAPVAGADGSVRVINTTNNTADPTPIPVGEFPVGIAITPDGSRAYVANSGPGTVSVIHTATDATVGMPIPVPAIHDRGVAITPDGTRAYVTGQTETGPGGFSVIDTATNPPSPATEIGTSLDSVAITPDGTRAYMPDTGLGSVFVIDTATNAPVGSPIPLGASTAPNAIAITPNQPAIAAFSATPGPAGSATTFDGTGSPDSDGAVVRFDWDFGDGTTLADGGPTPTHTYAAPGTYTVFLRVTDNEGCSLSQVFTGQTMSCNGSGEARVHQEVAILPPDTDPPGLSLFGPKNQKLDGAVEVKVLCDEPCAATGNGKLVITTPSGGGKSDTKRRGLNLKPASARLTAGEPVTLKVKISKRVRGAASEALAGDGEVTARITIVGVDAAGNEAKAKRTIRLRLKRSSS